jgi:predicted RNase H-like nuclease (RuvC/YqgF family)
MNWAASAYAAIRKIILLEERMENLTAQVDGLATTFTELDRRLIRLEAKFELLERMASPSRRALSEKSEK